MKFLRCLFCSGELDIIAEEGIDKIVACRSCERPQPEKPKKKEPEVFKRRSSK
jgi:hypothetical protein